MRVRRANSVKPLIAAGLTAATVIAVGFSGCSGAPAGTGRASTITTTSPAGSSPATTASPDSTAVVVDAAGMSDAEMQSLAAEFNLSETTFVLPPDNPQHSARVRIFNRVAEMGFAGHPNVGTAFVLAREDEESPRAYHFEEPAGLVEVTVLRVSLRKMYGLISGFRHRNCAFGLDTIRRRAFPTRFPRSLRP